MSELSEPKSRSAFVGEGREFGPRRKLQNIPIPFGYTGSMWGARLEKDTREN